MIIETITLFTICLFSLFTFLVCKKKKVNCAKMNAKINKHKFRTKRSIKSKK